MLTHNTSKISLRLKEETFGRNFKPEDVFSYIRNDVIFNK